MGLTSRIKGRVTEAVAEPIKGVATIAVVALFLSILAVALTLSGKVAK